MPVNLYFVILSASIMLGGVSLVNTSLSLLALHNGYDQGAIGLISTSFYIGFFIGSFLVPYFLRAVGQIRCFAVAGALHALGALMMFLFNQIEVWYIFRVMMGVSYIFFSTIVESWINESVHDGIRARSLGIYRFIEQIFIMLSLYVLPLYGMGSRDPIIICAILFTLSIIPVSLVRIKQPMKPKTRTFDPIYLWKISPFVLVGCLAIGITNAGFRSLAPIFVINKGLGELAVANFIIVATMTGGLMQYPLGYLSDKFSRRWVIMFSSLIAMAGVLLMLLDNIIFIYIGIALFGGFSLCLYYLMSAFINDRIDKGNYNLVSISMTFTWAVGGMAGPILVGYGMDHYGNDAYIYIIAITHLALSVFSFYRIIMRPDSQKPS